VSEKRFKRQEKESLLGDFIYNRVITPQHCFRKLNRSSPASVSLASWANTRGASRTTVVHHIIPDRCSRCCW
jgi:hypothetical protein